MSTGRSVRLFLAEGTATGIITAEIVNWTGHVIAAPRTRLDAALKRPELKRTGVYVLYGMDFDLDLPVVYVGEGDDISARLYSHSKDDQKTFWERFAAVTNKDMNLTKAHVKYLEGRLIALLKEAKKCVVANKTEPTFDRLPEADISDMEAFIGELKLVFPVIGIDFLRKPAVDERTVDNVPPDETVFVLENKTKGIKATAQEIDGEFVIFKGATGNTKEAISFNDKKQAFRAQIFESGRAEQRGKSNFILLENVAFSSPSAAAVFLFGTSRNGRTDWLVKGKSTTYADWKENQVNL